MAWQRYELFMHWNCALIVDILRMEILKYGDLCLKLLVQVVSADTYLGHNNSPRKGLWILILPFVRHRKSKRKAIADWREQMRAETSVFLTWALEVDRGLPQIPRRPVAEGGFKALVSQPSSHQIIDCWWARTLEWVHIH